MRTISRLHEGQDTALPGSFSFISFRFLSLPVEMSDDEGSPPSPKRSRTGEETPKSGDGPKGKGKLTANQESGDLRTIIRETLLDVLKEKEDARPSTLRDPPRTSGERWTGRRVITYLYAGRVGGGRYGKQGHWLVGAVCHNGGQKYSWAPRHSDGWEAK